MSISLEEIKEIAKSHCMDGDERTMVDSFIIIWDFLNKFPSELSWRGSKPDIHSRQGVDLLASKYFTAYRRSDFPPEPSTVPDEMVSVIMEKAYGYTPQECERIKFEHQRAMCAENCVGDLLERYIDTKLRQSNWSWCCGEFVRAIDFLGKNDNGDWIALQIKNRDNSENSSSSAIRDGTKIQKWFRTYSKDTKKGRPSLTNWDNLPSLMQGYGLSEQEFKLFVSKYILEEKRKKTRRVELKII